MDVSRLGTTHIHRESVKNTSARVYDVVIIGVSWRPLVVHTSIIIVL